MKPSIVVLVDRTATAEHTARYAAALAAPLHAHVVLLHVYHDEAMLLAPELALSAASQTDRSYANAVADMAALAQKLPDATATVSVKPEVDAVADAVRQYQPLLLAMGLSPEHDILDHLLRNRLLPLLRAGQQCVLLVPAGTAAPAAPRQVVVALDAEPFRLRAVGRQLAPLLAAWQAAYAVAHVLPNDDDSAPDCHLSLAGVRASGLLPPGSPLRLGQKAAATPAGGILQAIADTQADLLVLLARPRSFLGQLFHHSVTAEVLRRSPVPVLLVPAQAPDAPDWMPGMS